MSAPQRKRVTRKCKIVAYSGRGEIYSWLRAHHGQIAALRLGAGRPWAEIIADMRQDLAGSEGSPALSLKNVCNIWQRVCRDVAAIHPAAPKRLMPSRLPKDWRPEVVPPPPPPVGHAGALQARPPPGRPEDEELSDHAKEEFAKFDAMLAKHDKRFRF